MSLFTMNMTLSQHSRKFPKLGAPWWVCKWTDAGKQAGRAGHFTSELWLGLAGWLWLGLAGWLWLGLAGWLGLGWLAWLGWLARLGWLAWLGLAWLGWLDWNMKKTRKLP